MLYSIIQISKINTSPFSFVAPTTSYPMSPFISTEILSNENDAMLKVRATLFIDARNTASPTVNNIKQTNQAVEIIYAYDYSEEIPTEYDAWYVEIDCITKTLDAITNTITFLRDLDPKTSRGTETRVQPTN
jgi:hypothetical protein